MYTNLIRKRPFLHVNAVRLFVLIYMFFSLSSFDIHANWLNVYYKSDKVYTDARLYGLKAACKDGKYGFVNKKGKFIIPPIFDSVGEFQNELCIVQYLNKWGMINLHGETIVQPIYKSKPDIIEFTDGSTVTRCDYFEDGIMYSSYAVLYLKYCTNLGDKRYYEDPRYELIKVNERLNLPKSLFLVVGEIDHSFKLRGIYGESYWIDPRGMVTHFDSICRSNISGLFAAKVKDRWYVYDENTGKSAEVDDFDSYQALTKGLLLKCTRHKYSDYDRYEYWYLDSRGKLRSFDGYDKFQENIEKYLTFVGPASGRYLILRNSDNKVIAEDVCFEEKLGNAVYELKRTDGSKFYIRSDGSRITEDIVSLKQEGSFVKIGVRYQGRKSGSSKCGYGILNLSGEELVPPVLPEEEVVICGDSYAICGTNCLNGNMIYASSDGWYQEVRKDDIVNLKKTMKIFAQKSFESQSEKILTFKFPQNHTLVKSTFNNTYQGYVEETFNGVTYEQPLLGYFSGCKNQAYIISRKNENNTPYLKVFNKTFNLNEVCRQICGKDFKIEAYYGDIPTFKSMQLVTLSDGKVMLKLESGLQIDTDLYISGRTWYSLNASTQAYLRNLAIARARDLKNTVQSHLVILDLNKSMIDKILLIDSCFNPMYEEGYDIYVSDGEFYLFNTSYLARFSNSGELIWEYNVDDDFLYDFDVSDSTVVITGFNTKEKYYDRPNPMVLLLERKSGEVVKRSVESYKIDGEVNMFWPNVAFVENGYVLQRNTEIKYDDECFLDGDAPLHKEIREYDKGMKKKFKSKFIGF